MAPNNLLPPDMPPAKALDIALICLALAVVLPLMLYLHLDYLAFVALGPGGTPTTYKGFLRIKVLECFALRHPYLPPPIPEHLHHEAGYLRNLPQRPGPRPETRGIAPHRQITQKADQAQFQRLASSIEHLASTNSSLMLKTTCFETHTTGLFSTDPSASTRTCGGEVCHAHPSDGSMHMTLHPADIRVVLEAGWGERHPLARGGWLETFVPEGFVMVYAPRSEAEVGAVMRVVRAAGWFVRGGGDAEVGDGGKGAGRRDSGYGSEQTREVDAPIMCI